MTSNLYRGRVTKVNPDGKVFVQVPTLGFRREFGPLDVTGGLSLSTEDRVLVGQIGEEVENLIVVSALDGTPNQGGGDPGTPAYQPVFASFAVPESVWTVQHNLNYMRVDVIVMDSDGEVMLSNVEYTSNNVVTVRHVFPTAGAVLIHHP